MDNLVSLLRTEGPSALNDEVKTKVLDVIQTWALATHSRSGMFYIQETYRNLQRDGFSFPPKREMASSMLDSSAVSFATSYFTITTPAQVLIFPTSKTAPGMD